MPLTVTAHTDPAEVSEAAAPHLGAEPTRGNQLLTLLRHRTEHPVPGRYWLARDGDVVRGVAFHSPAHMPVVLAPMEPEVAQDLAEHVAGEGGVIPGVRGEVGAAASFAGRWTELRGTAAEPEDGQRLYELQGLTPPPAPPGGMRPAVPADRDVLVEWTRRFHEDAAVIAAEPPESRVDAYLAGEVEGGGLWVWDDEGPRAMAALTPPISGVTRVGMVYTAKEHRRQGYGGAVVAGVSAGATGRGHRVVLYTQLANPTSNALYRRMGYVAVAEILGYRFD